MKLSKSHWKHLAVYIIALVFVFGIFKMIEAVRAGSLNPSAAPVATMHSLEDIYNRVAGTYDASGETANANGTVMQQLKDIKDGFGM